VIKEWLEDETDIELNSYRLCLLIIDNQFVILWNPMDETMHRRDYLKLDHFNYMYQKLDLYTKEGWTYVALNFKTDPITNLATIWGYMATSDQCTQVSTPVTLPGPIVDDNKFIWCLGSTVVHNQITSTYELRYGLKAIINNWAILENTIIERWDAMDYFGFQCSDYCRICRTVDQPKCLEDFESNLLHFWDFAPFRWYRPVFDYGRINSPIPLETVMTNQGLYTHHNGMWFDGKSWLTPNQNGWNVHSWTVDVWFKFYDSVEGTLIENNSTFPDQWSIWFFPPNNVTFQLNMNTINTTFTFNDATDFNKWFLVQVATNKKDKNSKI